MMMFPNGNLAIGGTTASEKLHVYGNILTTGAVILPNNENIKLKNSAGASLGVMYMATSDILNIGYESSRNGCATYINGETLRFRVGSTNAVAGVVLNNGYWGLNVTSPTERLHVGGNILATGAFDSYSGNSHYLVKGKEIVGSYQTNYFLCDSAPAAGMTTWLAGRTVVLATGSTKTRAVTIDASQNVGIGISSPTQKLHVKGKGIFADATNPWVSLQRDGVNWYVQVTSGGMCIGRSSGLGVLIDASGNMIAPGGITANYSSDKRLKQNIRRVNASKVLMSLGGVRQYEYVASEVAKNSIYSGSHYGLIYQNVKGSALDKMCYEREDKMGALNYISTDFISIVAGATMENISEIEKLKRENRKLKRRVEQLEKRIV